MTSKYERQCWSCGSKDMEKDARGVRCQSCGATWNPQTSPMDTGVTSHRDYAISEKGAKRVATGSPSVIAQRRAARARGELPPQRRPK